MKTKSILEAIFLRISKLGLTFLCLFYQNSTFCQIPDLGACNNFAVFTAVGAIDNLGATSIYGNIGTNVGAFNGFPPGIIDGEIQVEDEISVQASIDVDALYSYFNSLSCDSVITTLLGNNQTLTANIYCMGSAATLEDTLIFDAQNNADAIFILKINGALTTSEYSKIVLINQAQAKNIFWQINGLFSLGDYSNFIGTVITNGAITLLSNATFEGRILSRAGAISLANNDIVMDLNDSPLPIELLSFVTTCDDQLIYLNWSTASESNNAYFSIEKSTDLLTWTNVMKIDGAGNSSNLIEYSTTIEIQSTFSPAYFRLKQTDFDGHFQYSKVEYIENCSERKTYPQIFPNPCRSEFNINYGNDLIDFQSFAIMKSSGEMLLYSLIPISQINTLNYSAGVYFIQFNFYNKLIFYKLIIVN